MCQELGRSGTWSLSDEDVKRMKKELENFKFQYLVNLYNTEWIERHGGIEEIFQKIEWYKDRIKQRSMHYYEDPELTCCGQG